MHVRGIVRPMALWSVVLTAVASLSCGGSTQQGSTPTGVSRCRMSLAVPAPLPSAGAQVTAQLDTERDCLWAASTAEPWFQLEPTSGQGPTMLTLQAAENMLGRTRSATITINEQQFTVAQQGAPCRFDVSPSTISIGHQGGRTAVRLTTLEGCVWTTRSSDAWLRVVSGSGGEASATLELAIDSNAGAERSAVLSIASVLVAVSQDAGPDDRTECLFSIHPGGRTVPASGGDASFTVSTLPSCAWGAISGQPWLTVVSPINNTGPGEVRFRVDPNPSPSTRSGVITAGTRRHVVQQDGVRPD